MQESELECSEREESLGRVGRKRQMGERFFPQVEIRGIEIDGLCKSKKESDMAQVFEWGQLKKWHCHLTKAEELEKIAGFRGERIEKFDFSCIFVILFHL